MKARDIHLDTTPHQPVAASTGPVDAAPSNAMPGEASTQRSARSMDISQSPRMLAQRSAIRAALSQVPSCVVPMQRKVDLRGLSPNETEVNAQPPAVIGFLRRSDRAYGTNYASMVGKDYGFSQGLQKLIDNANTHSYGFLQAAELVRDVRSAARIDHNGVAYELDRTLRGGDAARDRVYLTHHGSETSVIKQGPDLEAEANITASVSGHPNVIGFLDRAEDNKSMRLEYAPLGPLSNFEVESEPAARNLARGTIDGLSHVHSRGVVHADMGAANVFVAGTPADPVAKIADFGQSLQGDQATSLNLPSDVTGGITILRNLAESFQSDAAVSFRDDLTVLNDQARTLVEKASCAVPQDPVEFAVRLQFAESAAEVTPEILEVIRDLLPPTGAPPTLQEITTLRESWQALSHHPWITGT